MSPRPRIVLLPLDERPVNTGLPADVAAVAGLDLVMPPVDIMPRFREPGDTAALGAWLEREATTSDTVAVVVSIDMLAHGGLIAARISHDDTLDVLARLDVLRRIRAARPDLPVTAVSLITRATDSYSNIEEPDYWNLLGREIHAFGGAVHSAWSAGIRAGGTGVIPVESALPEWIRRDFAGRRLRNHQVTLAVLDLHWRGVISELAITADDTAELSAGSAEQRLLSYWQQLSPDSPAPVYPGADETGAVLVARAIAGLSGGAVNVRVVADSAEGMRLVPSYENEPLTTSVPRQVLSSGAHTVDSDADVVLIVHTPDPSGGDHFGSPALDSDPVAVAATVRNVADALDSGAIVALADLRFGNGADGMLVEALAEAGLLWRLGAYGGWNTAGNALGSTLALAVASAAAMRTGDFDASAARLSLARRVLDDYAWQAVHRSRLAPELFEGSIEPVSAERSRAAERPVAQALRDALVALGADGSLEVTGVSFPWLRSFEVDVALRDSVDPVG